MVLEALQQYEKALEILPDYAWVFSARGQLFQVNGEYEKALADFNRLIKLLAG